jgi:hypothetical protein
VRGPDRNAKDTGPRNLPLKGYAQNQVWCEIVAPACELIAWTRMIALAGEVRRWEPKRLRLRLFSIAGRLVRGGRRLRLRLAERRPWADEVTSAISILQALPVRLTSRNRPNDQEGETPGARGTPPTGATAGQPATTGTRNTHQPNRSGQDVKHGDGQLRRAQASGCEGVAGPHPRVVAHFTPTHASWMNLVECWFSIAERQAIHRGSYLSVKVS